MESFGSVCVLWVLRTISPHDLFLNQHICLSDGKYSVEVGTAGTYSRISMNSTQASVKQLVYIKKKWYVPSLAICSQNILNDSKIHEYRKKYCVLVKHPRCLKCNLCLTAVKLFVSPSVFVCNVLFLWWITRFMVCYHWLHHHLIYPQMAFKPQSGNVNHWMKHELQWEYLKRWSLPK